MPKSWLRTITSRSSFRSVSIDAIREVWSRLNIQRCFELKRSWNFCVCLESTCVGSNACKATINFGTGEINLRKSNCLVQHLQWKSPRTFRTKKKRSHSMQTMYFFFLSFFLRHYGDAWTQCPRILLCVCSLPELIRSPPKIVIVDGTIMFCILYHIEHYMHSACSSKYWRHTIIWSTRHTGSTSDITVDSVLQGQKLKCREWLKPTVNLSRTQAWLVCIYANACTVFQHDYQDFSLWTCTCRIVHDFLFLRENIMGNTSG